jgi:hypothetical protein
MNKPRAFRTLAILAATLVASACNTLNPAGLIAASRLDPLNTSPSEISVAVGVPETLRLTNGDAEFRIAFRGGPAASTIVLEEVAPLRVSVAGPDGPRPSALDETVYVARIAPEYIGRITAVQQEIRDLRSKGTDGDGSLTIRVVGGCYVGAPPEAIAVSTWLRTDPSDGFVQLTRRQDVMQVVGAQDAAMLISQLTPCASAE